MEESIDKIISKYHSEDHINESDLVFLKGLDKKSLVYLFSKDLSADVAYTIKCYLTAANVDLINECFEESPINFSEKLASVWVSEILKESNNNIIDAYIPLSLFDSDLLNIIRFGFHQGGLKNKLFDFENQIVSLIDDLCENENRIISRLIFLNISKNNAEAIKSIKDYDSDLAEKLLRVKDNVILSNQLIKYFYNNNRKEKKQIKTSINNNFNKIQLISVLNIIPEHLRDEIKKDFSLVGIKDKFSNIAVKFKPRVKLNDDAVNINDSSEGEVIDDILMKGYKDPSVGDIEVDNVDDLNPIDFDAVDVNENTFNHRIDNTVLNNVGDAELNKPLNLKKNRFKVDSEKKKGNIRIVIISTLILFVSSIVAINLIKSEIDKKNSIRENISQSVSDIKTVVNYMEDEENDKIEN